MDLRATGSKLQQTSSVRRFIILDFFNVFSFCFFFLFVTPVPSYGRNILSGKEPSCDDTMERVCCFSFLIPAPLPCLPQVSSSYCRRDTNISAFFSANYPNPCPCKLFNRPFSVNTSCLLLLSSQCPRDRSDPIMSREGSEPEPLVIKLASGKIIRIDWTSPAKSCSCQGVFCKKSWVSSLLMLFWTILVVGVSCFFYLRKRWFHKQKKIDN